MLPPASRRLCPDAFPLHCCRRPVIPVNMGRPEAHLLWKLAVSLGAQCSTETGPSTTHVVAARAGTAKQARGAAASGSRSFSRCRLLRSAPVSERPRACLLLTWSWGLLARRRRGRRRGASPSLTSGGCALARRSGSASPRLSSRPSRTVGWRKMGAGTTGQPRRCTRCRACPCRSQSRGSRRSRRRRRQQRLRERRRWAEERLRRGRRAS